MLRYWKPILDASFPTYTDEVERMFRDFFGGRGYPLAGEQRWVPPVDVHEVTQRRSRFRYWATSSWYRGSAVAIRTSRP
jgi:hypothetical protein